MVVVLEYFKLQTAVALTARRQAATAAGSVLGSPVLRAQVLMAPTMEEILVGDSDGGSVGGIDVWGGVSAGSSSAVVDSTGGASGGDHGGWSGVGYGYRGEGDLNGSAQSGDEGEIGSVRVVSSSAALRSLSSHRRFLFFSLVAALTEMSRGRQSEAM